MKTSFAANLPLLGLSFVLSISLFLFVQMQNSPTKEPTPITVRVTIKPGYSPTLYPELITRGIKIDVDGPMTEVHTLTSDPALASATINLAGAKPGIHDFPISITRPNNLSGLKLEPLQRFARVHIYTIISRKVNVSTNFDHQLTEKGLILEKVELRPPIVNLTGPENLVPTAIASVNLDLSTINPNKEIETKVRVYDENHAILNEVKSDPEQVIAVFIAHAAPEQKELVLNVQFKGTLPPGVTVLTYSVAPQAITVTGKSAMLAQIATSSVMVDLTGLQNTQTFFLHPKLPPGVTMVGRKAIKVTIAVARSSIGQPAPTSSINPLLSPTTHT